MKDKFIFQFENLLTKYKSQRTDIEGNLHDLHKNQLTIALKTPFLHHEEHSKAMNRLEVIKKDIQTQKHELAKINTEIHRVENHLKELKKSDEKPLWNS